MNYVALFGLVVALLGTIAVFYATVTTTAIAFVRLTVGRGAAVLILVSLLAALVCLDVWIGAQLG